MDRCRWPEWMEGRGRPNRLGGQAESAPSFPSRAPPFGHSGPPKPPGPLQFGQEPPHSHTRPRNVPVPQPLPKPAEGCQQRTSEGELLNVLVPTLHPLQGRGFSEPLVT